MHTPRRALAGVVRAPGSRPRPLVSALALVALAGLATLTACSASSSSSGLPNDTGASSTPPAAASQQQRPVDVSGLQDCDRLRLRPKDEPAAEDALDLRLRCLSSSTQVSLDRLGRRPTVVNLWASWCGPCREEMPLLARAHRRYADSVQFLGVDTRDTAGSAAAFLRKVGADYPQLADPDGRLLAQQRIPGLPITLLLGEHGSVLDKHVGPLTKDSLAAFLKPVLAATSAS